jgi:glycosyltransferase involved in cell wall biosynthesis
VRPIFLFTKNFPPTICGVGDYTYELYQRFKSEGYEIKVITSENNETSKFVTDHQLDGDVFPIVRKWNSGCIRQIIRMLKDHKARVFCVQYVPYSYNEYGFPFFLILLQLAAKMYGIGSAVFFHEVAVRPFHSVKAFVTSVIQRVIGYALFVLSEFSLTSNTFYQSYFWPFAISISPIPANLFGKEEMIEGQRIASPKIKIATFVNRTKKNVIDAITECIDIDKLNIEVTVIGSGRQETRNEVREWIFQNNIGNRVRLRDTGTKSEIAQVLYESDIFLHIEFLDVHGEGGLSSKSGVMAAAMAAGLPIVGSRGDMTDLNLYVHKKNVLLLERPSVQSIRNSIKELYFNESLRLGLSVQVLETYRLFFSWDNTVRMYKAALNGK